MKKQIHYFNGEITTLKQHQEATNWADKVIEGLERDGKAYDIYSYFDDNGLAVEWKIGS